MADLRDRLPENITGRFYVDLQCIGCEVCRTTAPRNFRLDQARGIAYVFRQPNRPLHLERCLDAMACCPVEAIGDDGE